MVVLGGTSTLGDAFGLLLGDLIIGRFGWQIFVIVFSLIMFVSGLAFYLHLVEIPLERARNNNLCTELQEQMH